MSHRTGPLDEWSHEALRELGMVLRRLRDDHGFTQRALAERCGLSQSTISRLENGNAPGVRLVWFARLLVSFERGGDQATGAPRWWYVWDEPTWVKQMRRFAASGAFAQRLRDDTARREAERSARMQLLASQNWKRLGPEFNRDPELPP